MTRDEDDDDTQRGGGGEAGAVAALVHGGLGLVCREKEHTDFRSCDMRRLYFHRPALDKICLDMSRRQTSHLG